MKALGIIGIMAGLLFHGIDDRLKSQELKIDQMQKSLIDVLQQLKANGTITHSNPNDVASKDTSKFATE
jgi:hypothetical protein